jgi:hypothetical protein
VAVRVAAKLKNMGGQVMQYPLRGLLLRAGSSHYKYCWATAPYPYFYFFVGLLTGVNSLGFAGSCVLDTSYSLQKYILLYF